MRIISRTPISTAAPVDPTDFTDHMRVDDALGSLRYAFTAAREIEAYADIALLDQTITAQADPLTGKVLSLPVGPVALGASVVVELIELDGSATPIPSGWFLVAGPRPQLFFDTIPGGPIRVTYTAGYGAEASTIPDDLTHAIMDQALKLYDMRGDVDAPATLAPSAARICARYRRVKV
ncbi:hypothetical protein MUY21_07865 [Aliiroseovarius sp. S2029]|uniref:head-tail connector protein n=1 Tax=Aliiroseovarius sp. S2029 TaxID=2936988 RepID=UPI0020C0649A|nr:hypothetical protein [Aliiroseovarius sp. S2029]MCK8483950.1 hypothetical protein [Aliiroseovarius sp. S2029]